MCIPESLFFYQDPKSIGQFLVETIRTIFNGLHNRPNIFVTKDARTFIYATHAERRVLGICLNILKKNIISDPLEGINIRALLLYSAINRTLHHRIFIRKSYLAAADLPPSTKKIADQILRAGQGDNGSFTLQDIEKALKQKSLDRETLQSLQQIFQSECNNRYYILR